VLSLYVQETLNVLLILQSDPFIGQRVQFLVKSAESPLKM